MKQGGQVYPVIFGYPGYTGAAVAECVVPLPLLVYSGTAGMCAVSEDPMLPITTVRVRNDQTGVEVTCTTSIQTDLLGQDLLVADIPDPGIGASPLPASRDETSSLYGGYHPNTGGGPRTAYDVVEYALKRWGRGTDFGRLRAIRDYLSGYLVDTWIDETVSDPWTWLEGSFLPDLPVVKRRGHAGLYLAPQNWSPSTGDAIGQLSADTRQIIRTGAMQYKSPIQNEFSVNIQRNSAGDPLTRVWLVGESTRLANRVQLPADQVFQSQACRISQTRYGVMRGDAADIDWTWDPATAGRVLAWKANRDALPTRTIQYDTDEDIREGEVYLVTDSSMALDAVPAVVAEPPLVGRTTRVTLRMGV